VLMSDVGKRAQVGFVMRLEGQRLSAALEDFLPDYEFAFEGNGGEVRGMYYHTDRTCQLNAHFGDMLHKIQDLEVSLVAGVLQRQSARCTSFADVCLKACIEYFKWCTAAQAPVMQETACINLFTAAAWILAGWGQG